MEDVKKQLHYPNGMPVPVREIWDVVDQIGYAFASSYKMQLAAKKNNWDEGLGLNPEQHKKMIAERDRLVKHLIVNHGDKMLPQARYTLVRNEMNEKKRYYRLGEYRLFIGVYTSLVVELGITPDELDIDPKKFIAAYSILDDTALRQAQTAEEKKNVLKKIVHANKERAEGWV